MSDDRADDVGIGGCDGFGFGPDARLRKSVEYRRVYDNGRRVGGRHFLCFFASAASPDDPPRLGVTVTRKIGNAVVRNRLRRVLKEFFRLRRGLMRRGFDVVINARASAVRTPTRDLWDDLETIFTRAGAIGRQAESPDESVSPWH